jgi:hypothetical protein
VYPREAKEIAFTLTENGANVATGAPNVVWVLFSTCTSEYTATAWNAGTPYAKGDLVYHAGECYRAATGSTGSAPAAGNTAWILQPMLHVLSRYVQRAAYADMLSEDGQVSKADYHLAQANKALEDELMKLGNKQGQVADIGVRTH